ncbi:MAG: hypothetical protein HY403_04800 [Elusimicrobia bacterium]|nr:hypothetical protein [Elusimicrobiota bacterium]
MRAIILGLLIMASFREDAGAFALLPQQMKEDVNKAFGAKKEDQQAQAPAPDIQAMLDAAKKAQEDLARELREEAERKAREAESRRRKMIGAGAAALAVLALVLKRSR